MSGKHETEREGNTPTNQGGIALQIASRGLSTIQDLTNFTTAIAVDALTGHVGHRNGNLAVRGMEVVAEFIELGQKHGRKSQVVDSITPAVIDAEAEEERKLEARLEEIRSRRKVD